MTKLKSCPDARHFFMDIFTVCTMFSMNPFACAEQNDDVMGLNLYCLLNSLNSALANCGPLSDITVTGIPYSEKIEMSCTD